MIRFFRHIRRALINQNQMGKYFKYAIGEVLLVVIGILIALQVNNWNLAAKNSEIEQQFLSQLQADTEISIEQLDLKIRAIKNSKEWDSLVLREIQVKTAGINNDSLLFLVTGYFAPPTFDPEDGTIKSILGAGQLDLISNQELRNYISSWESYLNDTKEIENLLTDFFFNQKKTYLRKYVPFRNRRMASHGKSEYGYDFDEILSDLEFENIINQSWVFNTVLLNRYEDLRGKMTHSLSLIQQGN